MRSEGATGETGPAQELQAADYRPETTGRPSAGREAQASGLRPQSRRIAVPTERELPGRGGIRECDTDSGERATDERGGCAGGEVLSATMNEE